MTRHYHDPVVFPFPFQDFVGATIVLLSGLTTVLTSTIGSLPPSDVGLAISYALQVSIFLNLLVRFLADMEMQMNAVERVKFYTGLSTEPYEGTSMFYILTKFNTFLLLFG